MEIEQTDVLVIGGGIAGTRAAIEAKESKAEVTMVMKAGIGQGGATGPWWWGGMSIPNGDTDPEDNPDEYLKDIINAAWGMCDEKLAGILAYEVVDRVKELESWGLQPSEKIDNKYHQHKACFGTRPRAIKLFGFSPGIIEVLKQQVIKRNIKTIDDVVITGLLTKDGVCAGAIGSDKQGRVHVIQARSTVVASGGAAGIFPPRYDAGGVGAGYAMGFHAGAELLNMEFIQTLPEIGQRFRIIPHPQKPETYGRLEERFLSQVALFTLFPVVPDIYNSLGERFLSRYLPEGVTVQHCLTERVKHIPFSTSDVGKYMDIAMYKEILEGRGTKEGGIYIDFSKVSRGKIKEALDARGMSGSFGPALEEILAKPQQARPFGHAFNGGLRINESAATTLPGLYAAGEVAGGPHGADRLGGNMVAGSLVFGTRAGRFAAERANGIDAVAIDQAQVDEECKKVSGILENKGDVSVSTIENKIRDLMWNSCLTVKSQKGLVKCLEELKQIRREDLPRISVAEDEEVFRALSIPIMLDAGEIIAHAALQRKESRGSHYREDYPERDDINFINPINISQKNFDLGEMRG